MALMDIETIVIAIMENRSFDHMLGYLALPGANGPVGLEGLTTYKYVVRGHGHLVGDYRVSRKPGAKAHAFTHKREAR